jgi:hypothetical protein
MEMPGASRLPTVATRVAMMRPPEAGDEIEETSGHEDQLIIGYV